MLGIFIYWLSVGLSILIAYIIELIDVKRIRKKLNLTQEEWNYIVKYFNIKRKK